MEATTPPAEIVDARYMGITVFPEGSSKGMAERHILPSPGALVFEVYPRTPAETAGLLPTLLADPPFPTDFFPTDKVLVHRFGDIILGVNGAPISSGKDLGESLKKYQNGDRIRLTILRDGKHFDKYLTLQSPDLELWNSDASIVIINTPIKNDPVIRDVFRQLIEFEFVEEPLADAIEVLCVLADVRPHIDEESLKEYGISLDTPVTLKFDNLPLEEVLQRILKPLKCGYLCFLSQGDLNVVITTEKVATNFTLYVP